MVVSFRGQTFSATARVGRPNEDRLSAIRTAVVFEIALRRQDFIPTCGATCWSVKPGRSSASTRSTAQSTTGRQRSRRRSPPLPQGTESNDGVAGCDTVRPGRLRILIDVCRLVCSLCPCPRAPRSNCRDDSRRLVAMGALDDKSQRPGNGTSHASVSRADLVRDSKRGATCPKGCRRLSGGQVDIGTAIGCRVRAR